MDMARSSAHRTIALVGGPGSGKTTLLEAMLFRAGAISRRGAVEQGTTVGDHDPEEIARGTTLTISLASLTWTDDGAERALTLIDTPGHPDFVGGVDTALAVADAAAIVVSAVDGVTAGTRAAWAAAEQADVPRSSSSRRRTGLAPTSAGCSRACRRSSARTSGRWSFRSARSRASARSPMSWPSAHWSTTRTVAITTNLCRPRPRTRSTRCTAT